MDTKTVDTTGKDILMRVAEGDENAFRILLDQNAEKAYKYVFRITHDHALSEEVVQDVFLQLWQTREILSRVENFGGYLYAVTKNYALNALKKMLKRQSREVRWELPMGDIEEPVSPYRELLDQAINRLPAQQQRAWILSRQLRRSYVEIAEEMDLSRETVKKYLQLATQSVTQYLEEHKVPAIVLMILFHQ
ncbi:MAG: sigma-70 family RNA polymerase sigma factor [Chitinophagaceae bacterium]|nr:sigma-70 family RNA polymerase sigma factor [Chitinophagaceae bacterium]